MRLLARTTSLALGLATTATLAADPPQAAVSPPASKPADAAVAKTPAATPLRLQLSQSELAAMVSRSGESPPNNGSAAAEESGSTESSVPASPTGRILLHPSPAGAGSQPIRPSEPVRATPDSKSPIACAARTALPWVATAGALFAAGKAGGSYVEPDFSWLFKNPNAREATDTWRNHAAPARRVGELPTTLHP
jgi:hypothetical protein